MKKYLLIVLSAAVLLTAFTFPVYQGVWGAHDTPPGDIFTNFSTWTSSSNSNSNIADPAVILLGRVAEYNTSQFQMTPTKFTFTDINGDGLPDFLYHQKSTTFNSSPQFYAIFLNNGNSNFNLAYKCVFRYLPSPYWSSYGDCAASAPARDPNAAANQNMLAQVLQLTRYYSYSSPGEPMPAPLSLWMDINGDGIQDFIGDCLYINSNRTGKSILSFQKICS